MPEMRFNIRWPDGVQESFVHVSGSGAVFGSEFDGNSCVTQFLKAPTRNLRVGIFHGRNYTSNSRGD